MYATEHVPSIFQSKTAAFSLLATSEASEWAITEQLRVSLPKAAETYKGVVRLGGGTPGPGPGPAC